MLVFLCLVVRIQSFCPALWILSQHVDPERVPDVLRTRSSPEFHCGVLSMSGGGSISRCI